MPFRSDMEGDRRGVRFLLSYSPSDLSIPHSAKGNGRLPPFRVVPFVCFHPLVSHKHSFVFFSLVYYLCHF